MRMPKAYTKLYNRAIVIEKHLCDDTELQHALDLMKEMAEAIERGIKYEDCPPEGKCDIFGHEEMRLALKKFKEWK